MKRGNKLSKKTDRVGEVSYTKYGTPAVVIEYVNNKKVLIEFQDEHKYRYYVTYFHFKNQQISNPYDKTVANIGYLGITKYKKFTQEIREIYGIWVKILERCYTNNRSKKQESYFDCEVCDEWKCFSNFLNWYLLNKYEVKEEKLCVDKDILRHGNRMYSPEYCMLVPERINTLFSKSLALRGDLPIGVSHYWYDNNRYLASMKVGNGKSYHMGIFDNVFEAFYAYKRNKESYIKKIADSYKDKIPHKLYEAMYKYEVLITD